MEMSVILELDVSQVRMICDALDHYGTETMEWNEERGAAACELSNGLFELVKVLEN